MAKMELLTEDVQAQIKSLTFYRGGWANDLREGWEVGMEGSKEILFELYETSGCIILALESVLQGRYRDKMAMHLVKRKLTRLVASENFKQFDELGKAGMCGVVTTGTKHHIRVMMEALEVLTAQS